MKAYNDYNPHMVGVENGIVIEEARIEHIPGIVAAHAQSFIDTYVGVTPEITEEVLRFHVDSRQFRRHRAEDLELTIAGVQQGAIFVAREHNEVVGYSGARVERGESRMDGLYVVRQGLGIGTELFHRAIDWQEPENDISLIVAFNTPAVKFHEKFGFKDTGFQSEALLLGGEAIPYKQMRLAAQDRRPRRP